jgi:hypothetical protein
VRYKSTTGPEAASNPTACHGVYSPAEIGHNPRSIRGNGNFTVPCWELRCSFLDRPSGRADHKTGLVRRQKGDSLCDLSRILRSSGWVHFPRASLNER